jgi:hypothetical protein
MADGYLIGPDFLGRIRRTVDAAEAAPMRLQTGKIPVRLEGEEGTPAPKVFRIGTFTGAWSVGSEKEVEFKFQAETPNTVSVTNLFWPLDDDNPDRRDCSIAKEGTAWFLLVPKMFRANYFTAATATQCGIKFETLPGIALATHSTNSFTMQVQTVPVVTAATLTTGGISLERVSVGVLCNTAAESVLVPFTTPDLPVLTNVTMTDTAVVFNRKSIKHFGSSTASDVQLTITTCATATAT